MDTSLDIMDSECMLKSDLTYVLDTSTNRCADCAAKDTLTATLRLASSTAAYRSATATAARAAGPCGRGARAASISRPRRRSTPAQARPAGPDAAPARARGGRPRRTGAYLGAPGCRG